MVSLSLAEIPRGLHFRTRLQIGLAAGKKPIQIPKFYRSGYQAFLLAYCQGKVRPRDLQSSFVVSLAPCLQAGAFGLRGLAKIPPLKSYS